MAAHPARRAAAAVNQAGLDFYDRLVDELLANGIEPLRHALPLGPAAGARGPRRLGVARDTSTRSPSTSRSSRGGSATASGTGSRRTSRGWSRGSATAAASTRPGRTSRAPTRSRPPITSARPHGRAVEVLRRESPEPRVGITLDLDPGVSGVRRSRGRAAARHEFDGDRNRWFLDPLFRGAYPADVLERFAPTALRRSEDGDLAAIARADRLPRRQLLPAPASSREASRRRPAVDPPGRLGLHGHGLGGLAGRAATTCSCALQRRLRRRRAIHVTENGAAFADAAATTASVRDPRAPRRTSRRTSRRSGARSPPACRSRATSSGRCSTTSSGHTATRGASASSTSTTQTLERVPKSSFHWYRDFLAATSGSATEAAAAP